MVRLLAVYYREKLKATIQVCTCKPFLLVDRKSCVQQLPCSCEELGDHLSQETAHAEHTFENPKMASQK